MKLFTLALGALGLAGLSVGQEGPTSIVVVTEISTRDPVAKDTPPPRGGTTVFHTMPCASPPCAAAETETPPPRGGTTVIHTMPCASPPCAAVGTEATKCDAWSCMDFGGSRANGGRKVKKHAATTTSDAQTTSGWGTLPISSTATPTPTTSVFHCPPGTCGPACRPGPYCRKKVEFGREALPTSQDLGGRSQRAVAREAKSTSSFNCPKCSDGIWPTKPATTTTSFNCPKCSDGMPLPTTTPLFETPRTAGALPRCTFVDGQYICPTPKAERGDPRTTNDLGGRSQRAVAREALPTTNNMVGRSQYGQRGAAALPTSRRYVAREAGKPTFTQPCHGGVCFTGTPLRPTAIDPLPVPTLTDGMPPGFSIPTQSDPWRKVKPTAEVSTLRTVARKA